MKKLLFLIIGFVGISFLNAQEIKVQDVVDFGEVKLHGEAKTTIIIENTGDKPLIISKAQPTCGCTVPSIPKKPIAPGEKGEMTVQYTTTSMVGSFNKSITIYSNAVENGRKIVRIKGTITQ